MEANILRILVILIGVALVAVVLVQQPKEGGMGAFTGGGGGSGASSTVFGAKGSGNFLFRLTAGLVLAFVISIIALVKVTNSNIGGEVLTTPAAESSEVIPGDAKPQTATESDIPGAPATPASVETDDSIPGADEAATTPDASETDAKPAQ